MKINHSSLGVCSIYEVVSTRPFGYEIWNIGKNNAPEGYLPFCRLSARQPFPGGRTIETDTLRTLKCDGWDIILDAIGFGPGNSAEMKKFIKKHERNPRKSWECERMRAAIPYLEKIGM